MKMLGDRIRIEKEAGQGGFGNVYKGYDLHMERAIAVKETEDMGAREANMLKRLDHSGLPRLYDIYRAENKTYLIMEWIEGTDLERYIEEHGAMPEKKAARIGLELLNILKYLHSLTPSVIYQDLKPANIMLMPNGHVKLIDFGCALAMKYDDTELMTAGTVGYGAPEQRGITGARHISARSDIYAWGAVMYSLLGGRMLNKPPYTMEKIKVVCPQLSFGMARVIAKAVSRNEKDRYGSAEEVIRAIHGSGSMDVLYRVGYTALVMLCVLPFMLIWYGVYISGGFGMISRYYEAARAAGLGIMDGAATACRFILSDTGLVRNIGIMLISLAWLIFGIKHIHVKRFIRTNRSIYLSSRRYPGLWIGALIAGIIFGAGTGSSAGLNVSHAEESADTLPLSFINDNGDKLLLKYGAAYDEDDDLRIFIDRDVYAEGGYITVEYVPQGGEPSLSRTIEVR